MERNPLGIDGDRPFRGAVAIDRSRAGRVFIPAFDAHVLIVFVDIILVNIRVRGIVKDPCSRRDIDFIDFRTDAELDQIEQEAVGVVSDKYTLCPHGIERRVFIDRRIHVEVSLAVLCRRPADKGVAFTLDLFRSQIIIIGFIDRGRRRVLRRRTLHRADLNRFPDCIVDRVDKVAAVVVQHKEDFLIISIKRFGVECGVRVDPVGYGIDSFAVKEPLVWTIVQTIIQIRRAGRITALSNLVSFGSDNLILLILVLERNCDSPRPSGVEGDISCR